jgi:asparagine synthase (glutamine-hydrolysing)
MENTPDVRFNKDEDYVEAFQEIFKEAVRCRLNGQRPVGVALSGGLDSGSVAVTTAQLLKREQQPVLAFSHVPLYDTGNAVNENQRFGDESPYVQAVAAKAGNIKITWIKNTRINPIAGQAHLLNCFPEPIFGAVNSFWLYQLVRKAKERQTGVLLLGQLGNATISFNGMGFLANLAKTRQLMRLHREIKALGKTQANSFWRVFASNVCIPLAPHFLYRLYCACKHDMRRSFLSYSAINPAFAKEIELEKMMRRRGHDPLFQPCNDTRKMRFGIIYPGVSIAGCFWHGMSVFFQLPVLDPTADKRVIEYCLSIPDDQYLKNGVNRLLVRRAFKEKLPDTVLSNQRKGLQAADIVQRLRAGANELSALINDMERDELVCKYVDVAKLRNCAQSLSGPVRPELTFACGSILMRGLMVGQCLQRFFK